MGSQLAGGVALVVQAISLMGVWQEILSGASRAGRPPLSPVVLILAVLSGTLYFSAGFSGAEIDWIKVIYGGGGALTCGLNLSQWYVRLDGGRWLGVALGWLSGLIGLACALRAGWIASPWGGGLAFGFLLSQGVGRVIQIRRFTRVIPEGASLLLWSANVTLNLCMMVYHAGRTEWSWVGANLASGVLGVVVLLQVVCFRVAPPTTAARDNAAREERPAGDQQIEPGVQN